MLTQVKEDNKEIATMERQVAETQDQSSRFQEELSQLDRYFLVISYNFLQMNCNKCYNVIDKKHLNS